MNEIELLKEVQFWLDQLRKEYCEYGMVTYHEKDCLEIEYMLNQMKQYLEKLQ